MHLISNYLCGCYHFFVVVVGGVCICICDANHFLKHICKYINSKQKRVSSNSICWAFQLVYKFVDTFFSTRNMRDIKQFSVKCSKFLDFSRFLVGGKIQSYEIWGSNVKWKMMAESTHLKTKVRQTLIAQRIYETIPCAHKFRSIYDIVGIPLSYVNKFTTSNSSLS